jgi:AraC-like DNA-binding protein
MPRTRLGDLAQSQNDIALLGVRGPLLSVRGLESGKAGAKSDEAIWQQVNPDVLISLRETGLSGMEQALESAPGGWGGLPSSRRQKPEQIRRRRTSWRAPAVIRGNHVTGMEKPDLRASIYREFRPPPALAEHVLCFWTQTISASSEFIQRVLPDCCVDILLLNALPMVIGPWTEPFHAVLPSGTRILGARCHPGLAASVLGVPASELLNISIPLRDLWGSTRTIAYSRVADQTALAAQVEAMEKALCSSIATATPIDKAMREGIRWIARHPRERIEGLSERLGLSSRQIQRRFAAAVGYGPKVFQSVLRFQRMLNDARGAGDGRTLADLAAHAGYSDQSHMAREIQRFANCPPSLLLRTASSTLSMSDLFKTGEYGAG